MENTKTPVGTPFFFIAILLLSLFAFLWGVIFINIDLTQTIDYPNAEAAALGRQRQVYFYIPNIIAGAIGLIVSMSIFVSHKQKISFTRYKAYGVSVAIIGILLIVITIVMEIILSERPLKSGMILCFILDFLILTYGICSVVHNKKAIAVSRRQSSENDAAMSVEKDGEI